MKKHEQLRLIEKAMQANKETIDELECSGNPQVQRIVIQAKAKIEAFQAVYEMIQGNAMLIKIECNEFNK